MNNIPATIELNPSGDEPIAAVIWLHGLGADGNDFVPVVERFNSDVSQKVRFIFPHAPFRNITVNNGMRMRGWYDIAELDLTAEEDAAGIQDSASRVSALIAHEESRGIKSDKIVLAGFSQGGAIALQAGLRFAKPLGGIMVLSAYLPLAATLAPERHTSNQKTPILMLHGLFDPIVPLMLGQATRGTLENLGYSVQWHTYAMGHSVMPEELEDIHQFLQRVVGGG